MYSANTARPLYALVALLERQSIDTWRLEHAPQESMTDALALHAEELRTVVKRRRGGYVSVTVWIESPKQYVSESYYFSLQKAGKGGYIVTEQHSTLSMS